MNGLLGAVPTWQAVGAVMLASALVAFVIEVVVVRLARRLVRRTETDLDATVVQEGSVADGRHPRSGGDQHPSLI